MAAKKRAIEARQGHTRGLDDIGKGIGKAAAKAAGKAVSKAKKDVADPKYTKKVYKKGGALSKKYKDYVLREMRGDF